MRDDVEIVDAANVDDRLRFERRRRHRPPARPAMEWGKTIRALVALYVLWAWFYFLPQWYTFYPAALALVVDLMRHIPRPPFL